MSKQTVSNEGKNFKMLFNWIFLPSKFLFKILSTITQGAGLVSAKINSKQCRESCELLVNQAMGNRFQLKYISDIKQCQQKNRSQKLLNKWKKIKINCEKK